MATKTRNYQSEMNWRDVKYKRFELALDVPQAIAFKEKLAKDKLTYMEWARKQVELYMKGN